MVVFEGLSEISMAVNESQNYIWKTGNKNDCLGEGSFGKVYRGIHKKTGDKVAVKTFKRSTISSPETRMLQALDHEYIIKLIAIEVEELTKAEVMIMELCNDGSLMNFLNLPENAFGLLDSEFLRVLSHLSGGLEYLKKQNVIHRDVKPDNIMRHIHEDGRVIYKLADFGSARELPEGDNFRSLIGTEAYLNPQIYKVCFFGEHQFPRRFNSNCDLWSIGVTLYQIATGNLPFMIKDRHTMLMIYEEMARNENVISAIQLKNEIVYKITLPETSRLSVGLKTLIVPTIAGLFKQNPQTQWSFTEFYHYVLEILSRKVINVFYVNQMQMLKVYVKPEDTFNDFKYYLSQQSNVSEGNQIFLYKKSLIINCFDDFKDVVDTEWVFLFDRSNNEVTSISNIQLNFQIPPNFRQKFTSPSNEDEFRLSHLASQDLCLCKNLMDYQCTASKLFEAFVKDFNEYCKEEQSDLLKIHKALIEKCKTVTNQVEILRKLQNSTQDGDFIEQFITAKQNFTDHSSKLFEVLCNATQPNFNLPQDSYLRIVAKELSDIKDIRQQLYMSANNKKIFDYEKAKFLRCVHTIMEILTDKIEPDFAKFVDNARFWYTNTFFSRARQLKDIKKCIHGFGSELNEFEIEINAQNNYHLKMITKADRHVFNKQKLQDLLKTHKRNTLDMKILIEENVRLLEEITQLMESLEVDIPNESFV